MTVGVAFGRDEEVGGVPFGAEAGAGGEDESRGSSALR